jgi:very-short-patch-repair endonuclease
MDRKIHQARDAEAWRLVERQHGVIARRQLLGLGFGRGGIEWRIARGRLHPVMTGVYAVGRPDLSQHERWMAAVLACGPGAALSHRSAAALWRVGEEGRKGIDISTRTSSARRRPGVKLRRRPSLRATALTECDGIPVTTVVQTLVDLAAGSTGPGLERAVNEADKRGLIDPEALRDALKHHRGQPGAAALRALLDRRTFRLSDSELERWFRPLARAAGLPEPLTKQWLNGFEVDFFWPELGLVVETDGLRYHRTPSQQARALRRDQAHTEAGLTPLRFSHEQIRFEPDYVRANLAKVARGLTRRRSEVP